MKILKAGKPLKDRKYKEKCESCGCRFEFMETEATWETDRNESYLAIKCPQSRCRAMVYITPKP